MRKLLLILVSTGVVVFEAHGQGRIIFDNFSTGLAKGALRSTIMHRVFQR